MHELVLSESLVKQLLKITEADSISEITSVTLLVGEFSGVDIDALEFALPFAVKDTMLEGTDFIFEEVKVKVKCADCGKETSPEVPIILCGNCQSDNIEILAGREFIIKEMELP